MPISCLSRPLLTEVGWQIPLASRTSTLEVRTPKLSFCAELRWGVGMKLAGKKSNRQRATIQSSPETAPQTIDRRYITNT